MEEGYRIDGVMGNGRDVFCRQADRPDGKEVLVAIGLEPDASGSDQVVSCYLIHSDTVTERRSAGHLKPPPP